jgi:hypothetical protein
MALCNHDDQFFPSPLNQVAKMGALLGTSIMAVSYAPVQLYEHFICHQFCAVWWKPVGISILTENTKSENEQ